MNRFVLGWVLCALSVGVIASANPEIIEVTDPDVKNTGLAFAQKMFESLEAGDPDATLLQQTGLKLHPGLIATKMKRAYRLYSPGAPKHALNLIILFFFSHVVVESSSGPILFVKMLLDGHSVVVAVVTSGPLLTQMVPGIDMGCFVIIGTYLSSPEAQELMSNATMYLVKGTTEASRFLGISKLLSRFITIKPAAQSISEWLRFSENKPYAQWKEDGEGAVTLMTKSGEPFVRLGLDVYQKNRVALKSLRFNLDALKSTNREHLRKWTLGLGDVRNVVLSTFDLLLARKYGRIVHDHFVEDVQLRELGHETQQLVVEGDSYRWTNGERLVDETAWAINPFLPEGTAQVRFKSPAIQRFGEISYHPWAAFTSIPECVGDACLNTMEGLALAPHGLEWLALNTPRLMYEHRWTIPNAAWSAAKVGFQLGTNIGKAGMHLSKLSATGVHHCLNYLGKYYVAVPPYH